MLSKYWNSRVKFYFEENLKLDILQKYYQNIAKNTVKTVLLHSQNMGKIVNFPRSFPCSEKGFGIVSGICSQAGR